MISLTHKNRTSSQTKKNKTKHLSPMKVQKQESANLTKTLTTARVRLFQK